MPHKKDNKLVCFVQFLVCVLMGRLSLDRYERDNEVGTCRLELGFPLDGWVTRSLY